MQPLQTFSKETYYYTHLVTSDVAAIRDCDSDLCPHADRESLLLGRISIYSRLLCFSASRISLSPRLDYKPFLRWSALSVALMYILDARLFLADFFNALTNTVGGIYILSRKRTLDPGPGCVFQGLVGQVTVQVGYSSSLQWTVNKQLL